MSSLVCPFARILPRTRGIGIAKTVQAREYVGNPERRGGSSSVFIRCSDDEVYNVKFKENNQASRGTYVLANELIASGLARLIGVPTPETALVELTAEFLEAKGNEFLKNLHSTSVSVGLHFGSHRVRGVENTAVAGHLTRCGNRASFPGIFAFDVWTNNTDRKMDHCLIVRPDFDPGRYYVTSVDHGHCFGGPEWPKNRDGQVGVWCKSHVSEMANLVDGDAPFDSWCTAVSAVTEEQVDAVLAEIPPEWVLPGAERAALRTFILRQRSRVAEILEANRSLFPNWKGGSTS